MKARNLVVLILVALIPVGAGSVETWATVQEVMTEAQTFFREAGDLALDDSAQAERLYRKALIRFQFAAEEGGIKNAALFYNIGSSYFRLGDPGRAILWYRRAQLINPWDEKIKRSLSVARHAAQVEEEVKNRTGFRGLLYLVHKRAALHVKFYLFAGLFSLAWIFAACASIGKSNRLLAVAAVLLALLIGISVIVELHQFNHPSGFVVVLEGALPRKGDGRGYPPLYKAPLRPGTELKLLSSRHNWVELEFPDGLTGWLPKEVLESLTPFPVSR